MSYQKKARPTVKELQGNGEAMAIFRWKLPNGLQEAAADERRASAKSRLRRLLDRAHSVLQQAQAKIS